MSNPVEPLIRVGIALVGGYLVVRGVEDLMGYKDVTYVIFDGDKDRWAYSYMRGWKKNDNVDFDFRDAHDLTPMTSKAENEAYVKSQLRERMKQSRQVIVLVGEATKTLRKFVPWEIELAQAAELPIIVVHLNDTIEIDRCPAALQKYCAIHVTFKMKIIQYALDNWPSAYRGFSSEIRTQGWRFYNQSVYQSLEL